MGRSGVGSSGSLPLKVEFAVERPSRAPGPETPRLTGLAFPSRLWLAFVLPWRILFNSNFAARIRALDTAAPRQPELPPQPMPRVDVAEVERDLTPALQLLGLLQREGRLVDFLQEDTSAFSDAEIGGAARVVHEGCNRALRGVLELEPVRTEAEGDAVTLEEGYDAAKTRVTGDVSGEPPYRGRLAHHGWRVAKIELPRRSTGSDAKIIAPAEVEL